MLHDPITVDFETEAIVGNPIVKPPKPVGCAIWVPGEEPKYYAWGHPSGNNIYFGDFHSILKNMRDSGREFLFHNAGFDVSVWDASFCNARFEWHEDDFWKRIHDTMYLLFLADPYSPTLALKPSAVRYLGMAAEEQDELFTWILSNVPEATRKTAGAYIARAPGELVGRYAVGDVIRTRKLFDMLHERITADGMRAAYDRERELFPTCLFGTQLGIRVDRDVLEHHESVYSWCLDEANNRLATRLGCPREHLEHDDSYANALEASGAVKEWSYTKTGKRSLSKDNLKIVVPEVKGLVDYSSALATCLQTFMRPWLEFSKEDGRLHPNWNQVKQMKGNTNVKIGTQTGRLSSDSPNFQNVPSEFVDQLGNPLAVPNGLHPLPNMRRYCLPEPGHLWLKRDFSSQEIRILAHFEDGSLCEAYRANPNLDPHQMAVELIQAMIGVLYARKSIKITGFSLIYGTGVNGLSLQLGRPYQEAAQIKAAYLGAMPDVRDLMDDVQTRGRKGEFVRTWGGRIYYAEPSKIIDGRLRDFAYKLLNYLIQGSAADQTKQSIIDWNSTRRWDAVFLATVHDEINISAPVEDWQEHMEILKIAMNKDRFDVPFLSEGYYGENWADLEKEAA